MGKLHHRMMDAEAEANREIQDKSYQGTNAYAKLTGADMVNYKPIETTGKSINRDLMDRARQQVRETTSLSGYQTSHLGGAYGIRPSKPKKDDEEAKKNKLVRQSKKHDDQESEYLKQRRSERRANIRDRKAGTKPDGATKDPSKLQFSSHLKGDNSAGLSGHRFQEPTGKGYNPYA